MTKQLAPCVSAIVAICIVLSIGGCYSGFEGRTPGPGAASEPGPSGNDDGGGDGAADSGTPDDEPDGGTGGEPAEEEPDPFELPKDDVNLLPFHVRFTNLANLVGVDKEHAMFFELRAQRFMLGDHDYANGVAPDLRWSAERMQVWVKALIPVCDSAEFQAKYPDLLQDPQSLLQATFARNPTQPELDGLATISDSSVDTTTKYRLSCLAALSSLEFVAD